MNRTSRASAFLAGLLVVQSLALAIPAELPAVPAAPARAEGEGPYSQLILRGVTVINGTGRPAFGPADVVIEGDRIAAGAVVGSAQHHQSSAARPKLEAGGKELDLAGHYVLPGLIDMHGHIGGEEQGTPAEYVYKLWLGHGITSIREPGCGNGIEWCASERKRSDANAITAPRIFPYVLLRRRQRHADRARRTKRALGARHKAKGALGMKCFGYRPDILEAAFDELKKQGMRSACHHAQLDVARVNVLDHRALGPDHDGALVRPARSAVRRPHRAGLPGRLQLPQRARPFGQAGRLWAQAAQNGSERYEAVIEELLALDFTLDPTFTIYQATRDLMRARHAEWHDEYTLPSLWNFYKPSRDSHG